jgi:hypothetical protein
MFFASVPAPAPVRFGFLPFPGPLFARPSVVLYSRVIPFFKTNILVTKERDAVLVRRAISGFVMSGGGFLPSPIRAIPIYRTPFLPVMRVFPVFPR